MKITTIQHKHSKQKVHKTKLSGGYVVVEYEDGTEARYSADDYNYLHEALDKDWLDVSDYDELVEGSL